MSKSEKVKGFFRSHPALSPGRFAKDAGVSRTMLHYVLHEDREPGPRVWPKIKAGMEKYGYKITENES